MIPLSYRLKTIANCVIPYRSVVDVGTDHCFVPIYLVQNDLIDKGIGTDINEGPIKEAKKNINENDLEALIDARCGNGLQTITTNDSCDVIIVAGMGGKLITDILDTGKHIMHNNKRLVLQPNVYEEIVRRWLCENYYEIVKELIIEEDGIIYEIIVADKSDKKCQLNNDEFKYGPILFKEKSNLFFKKYHSLLEYKKQVYKKVPDYHENKRIIEQEIIELENLLK